MDWTRWSSKLAGMLACLDFFLWGHMKSLVYASHIDSDEAVVARIAVVLRVWVAALWDKKLAFRTRERRKILDFYGRTATQGEKEIFGSRAAIQFSFGERERPAHRRSN
ncbi:hypothetical protein TNCV_1168461 [Trichonephila clavipes]|uniref:Uncharacterized protein n=1 Tax=Trichonephila clavipes TaxID=2585209 RepID=A0A8X6T557_TRICX|nr:hypothetical protein TNCV_1168461 [Trichonephila clavipes]